MGYRLKMNVRRLLLRVLLLLVVVVVGSSPTLVTHHHSADTAAPFVAYDVLAPLIPPAKAITLNAVLTSRPVHG